MRISKFMHDTILEYNNILYAIVISIMAYLVQNFWLFFSITDSTKYTVTMLFCHDLKVSPTTNNLPNFCLSQLYCQHERCQMLNRRRLICGYFIPLCSVSDVNGVGEWLQCDSESQCSIHHWTQISQRRISHQCHSQLLEMISDSYWEGVTVRVAVWSPAMRSAKLEAWLLHSASVS